MDLLEQIASAGVVGCGGAGFPTHVKLKGKFTHWIINGAECEPLLRNDRYLMRTQAPALVEAACAVAEAQGIGRVVFALKGHYREECAALRRAIEAAGANADVQELVSFYPAGDEQSVVYEVTGRIVPPAGLPSEVGAVVSNVGTVYAIYEALHGRPFTHRYLTVTGLVHHPAVLHVPVGTSFRYCLDLAGGTLSDDFFVVSGGPMMGCGVPAEKLEDTVVTKTTSGILVLPPDGYHAAADALQLQHMLNRARSACIQCSACTQLCPRHLLGHPLEPHRIMRRMAVSTDLQVLLQESYIRTAQLCCECGVCETYACPMGLQPRKINSLLKQELAKAGMRYPRGEGPWVPDPEREQRKVPTERIAARTGVYPYWNFPVAECIEDTPPEVRIPTRMHVGVPALPEVIPGDIVHPGTVIARPPEGALGAMIHASIGGRVQAVGEKIVITAE